MIVQRISQDFQWVIGFALPISRELYTWLRRKLLHVAFEETRSNVVELIKTNMNYASSNAIAIQFPPDGLPLENKICMLREIFSLN